MWEQIANLFGGTVLSGVKDLIQTFKLPPEQQLQFEQRLTELTQDYKKRVIELEAADRNSARQREIAVKDRTVSNLAYMIVGAFVVVGGFMIVHPYLFPGMKLEPEMLTLVGTIVGYLAAKAEQVASYYFGSSMGSDRKTDWMLAAGRRDG